MDIPYTVEELRLATHDLVRANGLPACYLRPIAFFGYGSLGGHTRGIPVETVIMSWPWGAYLGEDALAKGITAKVSSWTRVGPNHPHVSRRRYLNSMLATTEARRGGYDEAILLTDDGFVADGPGENIFVVRHGVLRTPPLSTSILPGLTREAVITIAHDLGHVVEETPLIRSDLYLADEVFMTGTAAEVRPSGRSTTRIGVGPVACEIQTHYLDDERPQRALVELARRRGDSRRSHEPLGQVSRPCLIQSWPPVMPRSGITSASRRPGSTSARKSS
jgi:branched-chain amino acid aminotransferase